MARSQLEKLHEYLDEVCVLEKRSNQRNSHLLERMAELDNRIHRLSSRIEQMQKRDQQPLRPTKSSSSQQRKIIYDNWNPSQQTPKVFTDATKRRPPFSATPSRGQSWTRPEGDPHSVVRSLTAGALSSDRMTFSESRFPDSGHRAGRPEFVGRSEEFATRFSPPLTSTMVAEAPSASPGQRLLGVRRDSLPKPFLADVPRLEYSQTNQSTIEYNEDRGTTGTKVGQTQNFEEIRNQNLSHNLSRVSEGLSHHDYLSTDGATIENDENRGKIEANTQKVNTLPTKDYNGNQKSDAQDQKTVMRQSQVPEKIADTGVLNSGNNYCGEKRFSDGTKNVVSAPVNRDVEGPSETTFAVGDEDTKGSKSLTVEMVVAAPLQEAETVVSVQIPESADNKLSRVVVRRNSSKIRGHGDFDQTPNDVAERRRSAEKDGGLLGFLDFDDKSDDESSDEDSPTKAAAATWRRPSAPAATSTNPLIMKPSQLKSGVESDEDEGDIEKQLSEAVAGRSAEILGQPEINSMKTTANEKKLQPEQSESQEAAPAAKTDLSKKLASYLGLHDVGAAHQTSASGATRRGDEDEDDFDFYD